MGRRWCPRAWTAACSSTPSRDSGAGGCCTAGGSRSGKGSTPPFERSRRCRRNRPSCSQGPVDPGYREQLTRIAAAAGAGGRIEFAQGPHDLLPAVYAAADALVFPVRWREPWGLVPLEAMATGRPVIASRAGGGASEYLVDGGNCLQFAPGDPAGLADAVSRIAGDRPLRERLVDAGRETAARFTQRAFVERIERELLALTGR